MSPEEISKIEVSFDDAKFMPAFVLTNQLSRKPIPYDKETQKYIAISGHIETLTDFGGHYTEKYVDVRHCDESDFSQSAFTLNYYKQQKKVYGDTYDPICFDKAGLKEKFKGDELSLNQVRFYFRINRRYDKASLRDI